MKHVIADSQAAFYTAGSGLRGVPILVMDKDNGTLEGRRVYSNTATRLTLDIPLKAASNRNNSYFLGSIPTAIESGDLTFGNPRVEKTLFHAYTEYERGSHGSLLLLLCGDPASQTQTNWHVGGTISLNGRGFHRLRLKDPKWDRFRVLRYKLVGTSPTSTWAITHFAFEYEEVGDVQ